MVKVMRKVPLRKCVATLELLPKKELIRIVKTPEGEIIIDLTGKANGRGAYLKPSYDAVALASKTKALSRSLGVSIPDAIYQELYEIVGK